MPQKILLVELPPSTFTFDARSEHQPTHHLEAFLTRAAGFQVDVRTATINVREYATLAGAVKAWLKMKRLPVDIALVPMPLVDRKTPPGHAVVPVAAPSVTP